MKKTKQSTGITLIALIITVVVLLILAGVSINMVIGENGLIKKAQSGVDTYQNSATEEQVFLNEIENYIAGGLANIDSIGGKKDKLPPKPFEAIGTVKGTSIEISGSTEDEEETEASLSSGLKAYYFSIDDGATWVTNDDPLTSRYTFTEVADPQACSPKMKAIDNAGNVTITSTLAKHTVTYYARNGSTTSQSVTIYGNKYAVSANSFSAPSGYGFSGWSTEEGSKDITYSSNSVADSSNLNLYAVWECATLTYCQGLGYPMYHGWYISNKGTDYERFRAYCDYCNYCTYVDDASMENHQKASHRCEHGYIDRHEYCTHGKTTNHVY